MMWPRGSGGSPPPERLNSLLSGTHLCALQNKRTGSGARRRSSGEGQQVVEKGCPRAVGVEVLQPAGPGPDELAAQHLVREALVDGLGGHQRAVLGANQQA